MSTNPILVQVRYVAVICENETVTFTIFFNFHVSHLDFRLKVPMRSPNHIYTSQLLVPICIINLRVFFQAIQSSMYSVVKPECVVALTFLSLTL